MYPVCEILNTINNNCEYFLTKIRFHCEELLATRPTPKLEDQPLSAARYYLFNISQIPSILEAVTLIHYCAGDKIEKKMRWARHVAWMGERRGVYRVLVGKPEGKRPVGRSGVDGRIISKWILKN
jgi:hypothetical protein